MSTWQPTLQSILSSLIGALILLGLAQAGRLVIHIGGLAGAINDRWGLRMARKELAQLQACIDDRQEIFRFAIFRLGSWLAVFSAALLFSTLALMGHAMLVAPIIFLLCTGLYVIAVQTTAVVYWSRHPDKFVPLLHKRIEKLQTKIDARSTNGKDAKGP